MYRIEYDHQLCSRGPRREGHTEQPAPAACPEGGAAAGPAAATTHGGAWHNGSPMVAERAVAAAEAAPAKQSWWVAPFPRVDWVAVPETLRARCANRPEQSWWCDRTLRDARQAAARLAHTMRTLRLPRAMMGVCECRAAWGMPDGAEDITEEECRQRLSLLHQGGLHAGMAPPF